MLYLEVRDKIIIAGLCSLIALGIGSIYFFHSMSLEESVFVNSGKYTHRAVYSYRLLTETSSLYDNKTVIHSSETAFIPLCYRGFFTINYILSTDKPPKDAKIEYEIIATLEAPGLWEKTYIIIPRKEIGTQKFRETFTIEIKEIDSLIQKIEEETRNYLNKYKYTLKPTIIVDVSLYGKDIHEIYKPNLIISFNYGSNILEFDGLSQSDEQKVGEYQKITKKFEFSPMGIKLWITTVSNMRYISYLITLIPSTALVYLLYDISKRPQVSQARRIYIKFEDKVLESKTGYHEIKGKQEINLKSFDDLIKAAEDSVRPIVHHIQKYETEEDKYKIHNYYVIDEDTIYIYKIDEK